MEVVAGFSLHGVCGLCPGRQDIGICYVCRRVVEIYWLFRVDPGDGSIWNYGLDSSRPRKLKI